MTYTVAKAVDLQYNDLVEGKDLGELIEEAYGPNGLGILTVSGIPNVRELRQALLPLAHKFAALPDDVKRKYEHELSNYSIGWSHGKERFEGKLDVAKGSYYANPQYDEPTQDEELINRFPFYCCPNLWPSEEVPEMQNAFKELGQLIVRVGKLIALQCDRHVKKLVPTYEEGTLVTTIDQSRIAKGRLLYYFPLTEEKQIQEASEESMDSWCGWHLDHGSLTGLASAMYLDGDGKEIELKDPHAGLYIRNRKGDLVKVGYTGDQLAFQIGESAQIHTGGKLVATPHCVRGASTPNVARATLAVFMQPQWDAVMLPPKDVPLSDCNIDVLTESSGVMDFNAFSVKRFQKYYGKS